MTRRISTTIVPYTRQYMQSLAPSVTIGELADFLTQSTVTVDNHTLELAIPVRINKYIGDINIASGDRLLLCLNKPTLDDLPPPLRIGDKILRFETSLGDVSVTSRGKHRITVGVPDDTHQFMPDVDLRYFVPQHQLVHISPHVLELVFDVQARQWIASRVGDTRVRMQQLDLLHDGHLIQAKQTLQFFAPYDTNHAQVLGEIVLYEETIHEQSTGLRIDAGHQSVAIRVGLENAKQLLNVSNNIRITQIINGLARYNRLSIGDYIQAYVMRLVSPNQTVEMLNDYEGSFLYAPMRHHYSPNALKLTDVHDASRVYTLYVGHTDEEKSLGFHLGQAGIPLDIDLSPAFMQQGHDPRQFDTDSPYQAQLLYSADENRWFIHLDADACMPVYLNNERLTLDPLPLNPDDVISLGTSINNYYVRLLVSGDV